MVTMTSIRKLRGPTADVPNHPSYRWAKKMRETFFDKEVSTGYQLNFAWPDRFHQLGQGRSVAYTSNKWKGNERDWEDFKHVAESPNQVYATDLFLRLSGMKKTKSGDPWPLFRPVVEMPQTVAELAPCLFSEMRLIEATDPRIRLEKDAVRVPTKDTILYGGYARGPGGSWNKRGDLVAFISVIHPKQGVLLLITGRDLDVEKDGIVG